MAQTYNQIQRQIQQLQRKAEILRDAEIKGVIERIQIAIAHYGLTAEQLGFGSAAQPGHATTASSNRALKTASHSAVKFSDDNGNAWSGRGPRPHWLRAAINAGRSLEDFRTPARTRAASPASTTPAPLISSAPRKSRKARPKKQYRDDAGHSWSGMGPMPGWLKAAMESGKTLEDFAR